MVIPSLILPVAGSGTPARPGGELVAGEAAPAGGLFAALLAALAGVVDAAAPVLGDGEAGSGEGAESLANLVDGAATEDEADTGEIVHATTETPIVVAGFNPQAIVTASAVATAKAVSTKQPPSATAPAPTAVGPEAVVGPALNNASAVGVSNTVESAKRIQQPVNVVQFAAPAQSDAPPAPVVTPRGPAVETAAAAKPVVQPAPPTQATPAVVPTAALESAGPLTTEVPDAKSSEPRLAVTDARVVSPPPDKPAAVDEAKSDAQAGKSFEKLKPLLDALAKSEESAAAPLRKAIEAFAKPVAGQSESVAHAQRPLSPVVVAVAAGESAATSIADVTKVTAAIAPAELGAEAPRSAGTVDAPEPPTRSTLPDLAQAAARSIRYLARNGEHRMSIRLVPESLGEVHIEVHSTKDALIVKLVSERAVVRDAMEAHVHLLRDSLSQEGLEVRSITVSDDSGSGRGAFHQRDAGASRQGERGQSHSNQQPAPDQSSGRNAKYAAPRARHDGAFDRVA